MWYCYFICCFIGYAYSRPSFFIAALVGIIYQWWRYVLGYLFRERLKKAKESRLLFFATAVYMLLNFLAVICNMFGRSTLTQIFGYTSIYTFAQIITLTVFVKLLEEAFLLQIQTSRVRKNYPDHFDPAPIVKGVNRLVTIVAVVICFIAVTTNLNIYNFVYEQLQSFLNTPQEIGSISFTFGGVVLVSWVLYGLPTFCRSTLLISLAILAMMRHLITRANVQG